MGRTTLNDKIISGMKYDREHGSSVAEVAVKYGVGYSTVKKYAAVRHRKPEADITAPAAEQITLIPRDVPEAPEFLKDIISQRNSEINSLIKHHSEALKLLEKEKAELLEWCGANNIELCEEEDHDRE